MKYNGNNIHSLIPCEDDNTYKDSTYIITAMIINLVIKCIGIILI